MSKIKFLFSALLISALLSACASKPEAPKEADALYRTAYKECKNICKELKNAYASMAVTFIESQKRFNNLAIHQDADIYNLVSTMDNNNKTDGEK